MKLVVHPDYLTVDMVDLADEQGWELDIDKDCPRGKLYLIDPSKVIHGQL